MEMMFLIDTNVFLEILLTQEKREVCKGFLDKNIESLYISDFSLHSIGVILFKNNKEGIFQKFLNDIIPRANIINLSKESYKDLSDIKKKFELDFDDAYQYKVANDYKLEIVTMDRDFEKVKHKTSVTFL